VVVVNYNVAYFLEQCLHAVARAMEGLRVEVWVVDNHSVDGSMAMVRNKFPWVKRIENDQNTGFSYANNQAMRQATGRYILLLNPDTVVEEDTFRKVVDYMDAHPEAGGLGVMMLDGKGSFLPESKRGLPTPEVAFYKIFGLSALFPRSKTFGRYHLGFLNKHQVHEIDILSGAFMLLRRNALEKVGLLDEDFFMYGEDIDLSYRITQAGYKNIYFPETRIIHYKGESTKKGSVNYVFVFYNAMIIFAQKHFTAQHARLFSALIRAAIYLRAGMALFSRFLNRLALPLADGVGLYGLSWGAAQIWDRWVKQSDGSLFPLSYFAFALPIFILLWLGSGWLHGLYDRPLQTRSIVRSVLSGTLLILVGYALLPEEWRFSRGLILVDTVFAAAWLYLTRWCMHALNIPGYQLQPKRGKRMLLAGSPQERNRVAQLLSETSAKPAWTGMIGLGAVAGDEEVGTLSQLSEIVRIHQVDEIIFCAADLNASQIIGLMAGFEHRNLDYKIAPPESLSIIGSNSINTSGDLYVMDVNAITKPHNRRLKRLTDVAGCVLLMILFPLWIIVSPHKGLLAKNWLGVLLGRKTWIGYSGAAEECMGLPKLKPAVLGLLVHWQPSTLTKDAIRRANERYAKDYQWHSDAFCLWRALWP